MTYPGRIQGLTKQLNFLTDIYPNVDLALWMLEQLFFVFEKAKNCPNTTRREKISIQFTVFTVHRPGNYAISGLSIISEVVRLITEKEVVAAWRNTFFLKIIN